MNHLLNICNINGAEVEPVDVIIGGSPCQDLSVAGKRAGLDGERSGLFMEQIRIIKEMRDADKLRIERLSDTKIRGRSGADNTSGKGGVCGDIRNTDAISADSGEGGTTTIESGITQHGLCGANQHVRPRYMVWENVPGAFSSNKGEDFRVVLEETAKIADETAVIPRPDKGKWTNAGAIMGDGWSIAWRVFDAQFWGVPQRRRRIALVADFAGQSAPEILFEREGVSGDIAESGTEGERVAGDAEKGVGTTECYGIDAAIMTGGNCTAQGPCYYPNVCATLKAAAPRGCQQVEVSKCIDTTNPDPSKNQGGMAVVHDARGNGYGSIAPTMTGDHNGHISDYTSIVAYQSVRRLTPLECERLQGFPDSWTDIPPQNEVTEEDLTFWRTIWDEWQAMNGAKPKTDKQIIKWLQSEPADSARYKALGNSIALPPWRFVLSRIHNHGARTMASLFDGIGGFPKIWQELGGQTLWCSEVEPFPIAVTRYHFKEVQNG